MRLSVIKRVILIIIVSIVVLGLLVSLSPQILLM